jgi:hypothetical protein
VNNKSKAKITQFTRFGPPTKSFGPSALQLGHFFIVLLKPAKAAFAITNLTNIDLCLSELTTPNFPE